MTLNFSDKVYTAVKKIPRGKVASYGQVARAIGKLKAVRAVGNALSKNRNKVVSCHRVVRNDGDVGGYVWGRKKKIALLRGEGIKIKNNKISKEFFSF